jgi:hypothetical protein
MIGRLLDAIDDPGAAAALLRAVETPELSARLTHVSQEAGVLPEDLLAGILRAFLDGASDDQWVQLVGIMGRAQDPGLAALRSIVATALAGSGAPASASSGERHP